MRKFRPIRGREDALRSFLSGISWWGSLVLGVACVALGISITFKPFTSLSVLVAFVAASFIVTGATEIAAARAEAMPRTALGSGIAWVVVGVVALAWSGITISVLAVLVGISLVVGGVLKILAGVRGNVDERVIAVLSGAASAIFGVLALSWPDVTVLVIALLVGPRTILFGFGQIAGAFSKRAPEQPRSADDRRSGSRWSKSVRFVGVVAALVVALGLLGISAALNEGSPTVTAFYDTPTKLPSKPGSLIRSERTTVGIPAAGKAQRILYTTRALDGSIVTASALVVVPEATSGSLPVVLWTHGTTGVARKCAPSNLAVPFTAGAMPAPDQVLERGWAIVAPDYPGLGADGRHPYLVGVPEARSALDAVRAAHELNSVDLSDDTVVWGHSQGGGAALWVGQIAKSYAPDVPLLGIAALAPASDLPALATSLEQSKEGLIFGTFMVEGYANVYPHVSLDDYIRASARTVVHEVTGRCLAEPSVLVSLGGLIGGERVFSTSLTSGPLGQRLRENVPDRTTGIPTFVGQGLADTLVLPAVQRDFVQKLCSAGQQIEYHAYTGKDHVGVVGNDSPLVPELLDWTAARLAKRPQSSGCTTTTK